MAIIIAEQTGLNVDSRAAISSDVDYVDADGNLVVMANARCILIGSSADLTSITDIGLAPGSVAHTAGWAAAWELDVDGQWVTLI